MPGHRPAEGNWQAGGNSGCRFGRRSATGIGCPAGSGPVIGRRPGHWPFRKPRDEPPEASHRAAPVEAVAAERERTVQAQAPATRMLGAGKPEHPEQPLVHAARPPEASAPASACTAATAGPPARDLEFDFHAHVKLAHGASRTGMDLAEVHLAGYAASFSVSSMGLYGHGMTAAGNFGRAGL